MTLQHPFGRVVAGRASPTARLAPSTADRCWEGDQIAEAERLAAEWQRTPFEVEAEVAVSGE